MSLDVLDATISRVLFSGPSKFNKSGIPYSILKLSTGQIAKGNMSKPEAGVRVRLWGEWQPQKGYDDPAFVFAHHEEVIAPSASGVADYLFRHIDGLGPVKSYMLVEAFGDDTLTTLRAKPEMALQVSGITRKIVEALEQHFSGHLQFDPVAYAKLIDLFAGHRIPKSIIKKLLSDWGSDAPAAVSKYPYMLLQYPRMGWKTVDSFATAVVGYDLDGTDRHKFAIVEALEQLCLSDGHTFAHKIDIEGVAFGLLGRRPNEAGWIAGVNNRLIAKIVDENIEATEEYALPDLIEAECEIAERLVSLAESARPLPCSFDTTGLNEEQVAALSLIESNGVAILTGPPGTGKTYTITKALVSLLGSGIRSIHIATPTGKAARRAAELLQGKLPDGITIPCTTIHRLLGPKPNETDAPGVPSDVAKMGRGRDSFSFTHNEADPILVDFLVIDESSMIDVRLGASLLCAVAPGTRVIFVGDHNQLPSVGPGSLLRDMMESGVPTAQLTQIQRNSGRIVRACHAIKDGVVPEPAPAIDLAIGNNWFHIELEDPHQIAKQIVEIHRTYRNFPDPVWDLQVVTPQKSRLPIACDNLNRLLSAKLNHFGKAHEEGEASEPDEDNFGDGSGDDEGARMAQDVWVPFRRGDKVIRTKNGLCDLMTRIEPVTDRADPEAGESTRTDWRWDLEAWSLSETDIVNGDMGTVMDIVEDGKDTYVVVKFRMPERLCRLPFGECHLSQAYAITCHKAQGSGFPYVIVPVHHSFYWDSKTQRGLFNREWIYTAISRSERMLMTVGQFSAVRAAVGRKTVHRRKTRLVSLLKDSFGVPA